MLLFFLVAIGVAILIALIPTFIDVDAKIWNFVRVSALIMLIIWAVILIAPMVKRLT